MLAGRMMPCQWIEVSSSSSLRTRSVTVSPSRQRSSGPGIDPLMVSATFGEPVKFISVSPIARSNAVPRSVSCERG